MEIEKEEKQQIKIGKDFRLPVHQEIISGPTRVPDPETLVDDHLFSYEKKQSESKIQEVKMADNEEIEEEDDDFEDDEE